MISTNITVTHFEPNCLNCMATGYCQKAIKLFTYLKHKKMQCDDYLIINNENN